VTPENLGRLSRAGGLTMTTLKRLFLSLAFLSVVSDMPIPEGMYESARGASPASAVAFVVVVSE
jgi:hypothetical protein